MAELTHVTAKEAIRKLVPLIAKTTGYNLSEEWINFATTWLDNAVDLVKKAEEQSKGKPISRKALLLALVDTVNGSGALVFDKINQETAKCVTSMIGTGVSGAKVIGLSVSEVGLPMAMVEATSLFIDFLSMLKDCEEPAKNLRDKIFDEYDDWLDNEARTWAVEFNSMIYQSMDPSGVVPRF
jgi:hypothetical protein